MIAYLSEHPKSGVLVEGANGVRKLQWARSGGGKSGGYRVIYYYHSDRYPLYLLTLFGKNEKANLNKNERNMLGKLVSYLIDIWRSKHE